MNNRRTFVFKCIDLGVGLTTGGLVWAGCAKSPPAAERRETLEAGSCNDLTGVSHADVELRRQLGYLKESPIFESRCDNCGLFVPTPPAKDCGKCLLFKGPVAAGGYCTKWAPIS